jgi:WD40 repeat protein
MVRRVARIFVSHSSHDNAAAADVRAWLVERGFPAPFLDYHPETGIPAGHNWEQEIYRQIKRCGAVVYLGSVKAGESKWCFAELALARSLDKPIFALHIEPDAKQPIVDDSQWTDFVAGKAEGFRRLARGMQESGFAPAAAVVWDARRSPYPGLAAFEAEDEAVFFGREAEVETLFARVNDSHLDGTERFIPVVGASGSGKSSLVRAGLMPLMRRIGAPWVVAEPMVPNEAPLEMLARCLAKTLRGLGRQIEADEALRTLRAQGRGLVALARDVLERAGSNHRLLLVFVDQAEELVTRATDAARDEFVRVVHDALAGQADVLRVVAALRSEFLTQILQAIELAQFMQAPFVLAPLPRSRLAAAIAGPAEVAGIELAPGLVERIVDDTGGGDALPLMQFTMQRLYDRMQRRKCQRLEESDYTAVGGVSGALEQRANSARDAAARAGLGDLVMPTLLELVGLDASNAHTRRRVRLDDLSADQRRVVRYFEIARLVSTDSSGGPAVAFVTHEALFRVWRPLVEALEANVEALREATRLERDAREWAEERRNEAYLLRGERLQRALQRPGAGGRPGSALPLVKEFVAASEALRDRLSSREADLLANRMIKEYREDPELAIRMLLAALEVYGARPRLQLALSYATFAPGVRRRDESKAALRALALSPEGSLVAAGGEGGTLLARDALGGGGGWDRNVGGEVAALAFAGTPQLLAVACEGQRRVMLLAAATGEPVGAVEMGADVSALAGSADLIVAAAGHTLRIWHATRAPKLLSELVLDAPVGQVRIAGEGRHLVFIAGRDVHVAALGFELVYRGTPGKVTTRRVASAREAAEAVAIADNGSLVALGAGSVAEVWTVPADEDQPPTLLRSIDVHKQLHHLSFGSGRKLVIGDWARGLRRWDLDTGAEAGAVVPQDSTGTLVAISPNGALVATVKDSHLLTTWHTDENPRRLRVHIGNAFSHARFAGDDRFLVTRTMELESGEVVLRDARTGEALERVKATCPTAHEITVAPDGRSVAINEDRGVVLRSIPQLELVRQLKLDGPNHVVFDRSGRHGIVTANFDGKIQAWRQARPKMLAQVGDFYAGSLDLTPDGQRALVANNGHVALIDLNTGKPEFDKEIAESGDLCAAIAPNGSCIAIGRGDRLCTVGMDGSAGIDFAWGKYNIDTNWAPVVTHIAFAPDSKRLASATAEGWVFVWDVASGELVQLMRVANEPLKDLAFSQSGQEIVVCSARFEGEYDSDGYAEIWPAPDAQALAALARQRSFRPATAQELAQFGLADRQAAGSAASMYHLGRRG